MIKVVAMAMVKVMVMVMAMTLVMIMDVGLDGSASSFGAVHGHDQFH